MKRTTIETSDYLTADERLADRLTEAPAQRRERVMNRVVDAETAAALARLWRDR